MAIVRINDSLFYNDPSTRTLINRQLKNLKCLTQDSTVPVKEYRFDHPQYDRDALVNIVFNRKNGITRIDKIEPIVEPTDNIQEANLREVGIQRGIDFMHFDELQSFTEFLSANAEMYGLMKFTWGSVPSFEIDKHLNQPIKVDKIDAFFEGYQIYKTPGDKRAPQEDPIDPTKEYVVLRGKARGNMFFSRNSSTRSDWYERLGETNDENEARQIIANNYVV